MAHGSSSPHIAVTSNEPAGEKHLVRPYDERPMVQRVPGRHTCEYCSNAGFRRSRLRLVDLPRISVLQWPIRCTRCGQRQYASVFAAVGARRPRPHRAG